MEKPEKWSAFSLMNPLLHLAGPCEALHPPLSQPASPQQFEITSAACRPTPRSGLKDVIKVMLKIYAKI